MNLPYQEQFLPAALIVISTAMFFAYERIAPGRELPHSPHWHGRAVLMNLLQLTLIGVGGLTWNQHFRNHALLQLGAWDSAFLEGLFYWVTATFVFYWWHRLRHANGFWLLFHQVHLNRPGISRRL